MQGQEKIRILILDTKEDNKEENKFGTNNDASWMKQDEEEDEDEDEDEEEEQ